MTEMLSPDLQLISAFLPGSDRESLQRLHALVGEIRHGVFSVSDESLARVKLAWWRDELSRLLDGQGQHPASQALISAQPEAPSRLDGGELGEILEGLLMRLEGRGYNDADELLLHAWRDQGALAVCSARLAGAVHDDTLAAARDLGLAHALAGTVSDFENERRQGRIWIPLDWQREAETSPESILRSAPDTATMERLLTPVLAMAEERFAAAAKPCPQRASLRGPALLAALAMQDARRCQGKRWQARRRSGLATLFRAWRAARQELRLEQQPD